METSELTELVRRHQDAVCAMAYAVLRDRARSEEIAQEAFLIAWRDRARGREITVAWLCGIARNLARNAARRRKELAMTEEPRAGDDPRSLLIAREEAALVSAALAALPERDREAVVLYYRGDESMRSVADALGITEANARQRVHRGRSKLRERLAAVEVALRAGRPGPAFTTACVAMVVAGLARPSSAAATGTSGGAAKLAIAIAAAGCAAGVVGWRLTRDEPTATSTQAAAARPATVDATPTRATRRDVPPPRKIVARGTAAVGSGTAAHGIDLQLVGAPVRDVMQLLAHELDVPVVYDGYDTQVDLDLARVEAIDVLDLLVESVGGTREDVPGLRVIPGDRTGPTPHGDAPITARFDHTPVADAIAAIAPGLDVPVSVGRDVEAEVTLTLDAVAADRALAQVLDATHLGYEEVTGIRVVATPDQAPAP